MILAQRNKKSTDPVPRYAHMLVATNVSNFGFLAKKYAKAIKQTTKLILLQYLITRSIFPIEIILQIHQIIRKIPFSSLLLKCTEDNIDHGQ